MLKIKIIYLGKSLHKFLKNNYSVNKRIAVVTTQGKNEQITYLEKLV